MKGIIRSDLLSFIKENQEETFLGDFEIPVLHRALIHLFQRGFLSWGHDGDLPTV